MAVLVELVVEAVLDELVELLLDGAMRLVAACNAEDKLLELLLELEDEVLAFELDAFEVTVIVGLSVDVVLVRSRPNPERLPRREGVSKDAKFSAAVTPVSRMVASTGPAVTAAVLTTTADEALACSDAAPRASSQ
jgi:hypothetical protein